MSAEKHQEYLRTEEPIAQKVEREKLNIRNDIVTRFRNEPLVGLELGARYKELTYRLVGDWYQQNVPEDQRDYIGVAAFGSTARGESCYYSDVDLAIYYDGGVEKRVVEDLKKGLSTHLEEAGMLPEVKTWGLRETQIELFQEDLVLSETIRLSESVTGPSEHLDDLKGRLGNNSQEKALFSICELQRPRFQRDTEEEVFNVKWDRTGGLMNYYALRAVAAAYGISGISTTDILSGLKMQGAICDEEENFLCRALSEYTIYRNEMHIYAQGVAERMGPRTKHYISKNIPSVGSVADIDERLDILRSGVNTITRKVSHNFLRNIGIDPEVFDSFSDLPVEAQLEYARGQNPRYSEIAAWLSNDKEVLAACLDTHSTWSTLQAISRIESEDSDILVKAEELTRDVESLVFARVQLAVNPSTSDETHVDLFRTTNDDRVRKISRKRLAHSLYDQQEGYHHPDIKHKVEGILFYPEQHFPGGYFQEAEEMRKPTPGKLYLNFAGRIAEGKNFIAYLKTLEALHQGGLDFEAHVYGTIDPFCVDQIHEFWGNMEDPSLVEKIKYHGQYSPSDLGGEATNMQEVGNPIFLYSKGLVTKELLASGTPVLTTAQGNYDLLESGCCIVDEAQCDGQDDMSMKLSSMVRIQLGQPEHVVDMTRRAQDIVRKRHSIESWGEGIVFVLEKVKPDFSRVQINGICPLDAAHGTAVWSRNLISYLQSKGIDCTYYYPDALTETSQEVAYSPLKDVSETEHQKSLAALRSVVRSVMSLEDDVDIPGNVVDSFYENIEVLAEDSNYLDVLASRQAQRMFEVEVEDLGLQPEEMYYPSLVLDEVNKYNIPINRHLKLSRLIKLFQLPPSDVDLIVTSGDFHPMYAVRESKQGRCSYVLVDHVLASRSPLTEKLIDGDNHTDLEKRWFTNYSRLLRAMSTKYLDQYMALWPVNQQIAINTLKIPEDRITYIPNGVGI